MKIVEYRMAIVPSAYLPAATSKNTTGLVDERCAAHGGVASKSCRITCTCIINDILMLRI